MNTRRTFLSMLGVAALMTAGAAFAATTTVDDAKAKIGEPAPNFTLADTEGAEYTLGDYKGKIVVLQWINPQCPVCRRVTSSGLTKNMIKAPKAMDEDLVYLTINSSANQPPEMSAKYLKTNKVDAPALIDADGTVGHMYGARTTPHVFVIDGQGILRYQGAFDSDPQGNKKKGRVNYAVNAVKQILAGDTVEPDYVKSYGCGVKYARD